MATRKEQLEKRLAELNAQLNKIKSKEALEARKQDNRKKILLGAWLLSQMKSNKDYEQKILGHMDNFLTKDRDRQLFGLDTKPELKKGE